ncbi:MBL fold metallo-hydrolase [Mucilaginibacter ginsenosidivorax]|uniref:MBL fold metallo-hydrolase n=1 Tax=Mucilaginibacter ginsenosidivorax TaxID=862126 RepID=A0A5B8W7H5_9SPHI|nr:MBL fold metallo-hydrolase [Mucilaginibacter ginsenosidivorax]QEC78905.1 MBL fold metallo-hydrolase [Mucilaginibacter ginsenosidivorax]
MKTIKYVFAILGLVAGITCFSVQAQTVKSFNGKDLKLSYYNSAEANFGVSSVLVSGKTDAILFDAQFTVPDAERLTAEIKKSGKHLKAIFISYGDPDFYFGLEVIKKSYPDVPVYSTAPIIEHIKATYKGKLAYWGSVYKDAVPKTAVIPTVYTKDKLTLEGKKLEIVKVQGAPARSFIWIPSEEAVIGGINVFGNDFHLWTADDATEAKRALWIKALDQIAGYKPVIVIPGHFGSKAELNLASVSFTKAYLQTYSQLLKSNKTSQSLIASLKAKYPNLAFQTALELSAKVNTGEMAWK